MRFVVANHPRDPKRWRRRFALLPTAIGTLPDGKVVRIWMQMYEVRLTPAGTQDFDNAVERRPITPIPGLKLYGADGPIVNIRGEWMPWLAP